MATMDPLVTIILVKDGILRSAGSSVAFSKGGVREFFRRNFIQTAFLKRVLQQTQFLRRRCTESSSDEVLVGIRASIDLRPQTCSAPTSAPFSESFAATGNPDLN